MPQLLPEHRPVKVHLVAEHTHTSHKRHHARQPENSTRLFIVSLFIGVHA